MTELSPTAQVDGLPAIDAALAVYSGYPDEVLVHWSTLQQHRDSLVRTARLKVREINTSTDPAQIAAVMEKYENFGEEVQADLLNANGQLLKLVDAARTEIVRVINRKAATLGQMEAVLLKYEAYPVGALGDERAAVKTRVGGLRTLKARLCEVCATCHPQDISAELSRYDDYGEAIADERQLLEARFAELIQDAREELRRLIEAGDQEHQAAGGGSPPVAQLMEQALSRYKHYPQVADLYASLRNRFESFTVATTKRLSRLYASDSIEAIDAALAEYSQSGQGLAALLLSLQRRRMQLCDEMGARLKAGVTGQNPTDTIALLAAAEPYGADVDNERHLLEERCATRNSNSTHHPSCFACAGVLTLSSGAHRLRRLLDGARAEIESVLHSENSRELEAVLDKYAAYPPEILDGPWAELDMRKEELRRGMVGRVEAAMGSMDTNMIDALLSSLLKDFGNEMDPYIEMLRARRDKMM